MSQSKGEISNTWVLLDSQSTVDLFTDPKLLVNIRTVPSNLKIHCNASNVTPNIMGDLPGYGPVWVYEDGIATILSLFLVAKRFRVQYDSQVSEHIQVWKNDGTCCEFTSGPRDLYYCDINRVDERLLVKYCCVQDHDDPDRVETVMDRLKLFNRWQAVETQSARRFQDTVILTTKSPLRMIDSNVERTRFFLLL